MELEVTQEKYISHNVRIFPIIVLFKFPILGHIVVKNNQKTPNLCFINKKKF